MMGIGFAKKRVFGYYIARLRRRSSVVEQGTHKPWVGGSNPPVATISGLLAIANRSFLRFCFFQSYTKKQAQNDQTDEHNQGLRHRTGFRGFETVHSQDKNNPRYLPHQQK